jgi:hypothetical protein
MVGATLGRSCMRMIELRRCSGDDGEAVIGEAHCRVNESPRGGFS